MLGRRLIQAFVGSLLLLLQVPRAAPATDAKPEQLQSDRWWRDQAVRLAEDIRDAEARSDLYYELAYVQARAEDFDKGAASAAKVVNPQKCVYAYSFIARQQHRKGEPAACRATLERARQVALKANRERGQNFINSHLIRDYFEMGVPELATSFVEAIPDGFDQQLGFREIAAEIAKSGKIDRAFEFVRAHIEPASTEAAYSGMANACAHEGHKEDVLRIVERLSNTKYKDNALVNLVETLVPANRLAEAEELRNRITDPQRRLKAKALIAGKEVENKNADAILAEIVQATSREEKLSLYEKLIEKQIKESKFADAELTVRAMVNIIDQSPREPVASKFGRLDDEVQRAVAKSQYLAIGRARAATGDRDAGLLVIAAAEEAITRLPDRAGISKIALVANLVKTQLDLRDLEGARRTVEKISDKAMRSMFADELALAFIGADDVPSAVATARWIAGQVDQGTGIGDVAAGLIRAGNIVAAKEVLDHLGDSEAVAEAYRQVGSAMIDADRASELHAWLNPMPTQAASAYACLGAAEKLQEKAQAEAPNPE